MPRILLLTDPNTFASLVLLNSNWRRVSQQPHVYAHHLARCPSYAASHVATSESLLTDTELPQLRRSFAREVKRNLFEAYLRPTETRITLISNSISSSSCPGGEGLQFSASPKGHYVLAYNSSRIHLIDVRGPSAHVTREFKVVRRPASVCIQDDASLLAVLSSDLQVDIFNLERSPPKRLQSILLDNRPRTIALSPCGSVLAAAYDGGIEVITSLNPGAIPAKRAVKCEPVDSLTFSSDGTQLLGTTSQSLAPNTVILTAPYYDPGSHMGEDNASALWTTSILFPNTTRDCSHATLLQESDTEEAAWTFTYDRSFETFRAVRIDDLRNGTTYFTGPVPSTASQSKLLPCTLAAASYKGELVSAGFQGKEVWLYGIPEDLSAVPEHSLTPSDGGSLSSGSRRSAGSHSPRVTPRAQGAEPARVPQWQVLCDKLRNTFISGKKITELQGATYVKWVAGFGDSPLRERLVIAARGVNSNKPITEEEDIDFVDGGRMTLLDFDYGISNGKTTDITIEVGTSEAEPLEEERRDMETEVALVRKRTVAQRRGKGRNALLRGETMPTPHPPLPSQSTNDNDDDDPLQPRRIGVPPRVTPRAPAADEDDELEEQEALDGPYTQGTPRSGPTLRRAATAAAMSRRLRIAPGEPGYRRADGRTEHPHESDADNWVPPPPPYQKEPSIVDLPAFLRHPAVTPAALANQVQPPPPGEHQEPTERQPQEQRQQDQQESSPSGKKYDWPPVPALPSHMVHPLLGQTSNQSVATTSNTQNQNAGEGVPQSWRRTSMTRPHSDSLSDRITVSPPESPIVQRSSRRGPGQGNDAGHKRAHSQSPVASPTDDSPTEFLHRYSIRSNYANPLKLNPPFASAGHRAGIQGAPQEGNPPPIEELVIPEEEQEAPVEQPRGDRGEQRQAPPSLDLQIPSPTISAFQRNSTWSPQRREDRDAQARSLRVNPPTSIGEMLSTETSSPSDVSSQPRSAPARASTTPTMNASWPPAPCFYQAESAGSTSRGKQPEGSSPSTALSQPSPSSVPPPDRPLIISTPTGLSGAYDDDSSAHPSDPPQETPIHAPRPRRNVPGTPTPTVGHLENLFSPPQAPPVPRSPLARQQSQLVRRKSKLRRTVTRRSVRVRPRPSLKKRKAGGNLGLSTNVWSEGVHDEKGGKKCVVM